MYLVQYLKYLKYCTDMAVVFFDKFDVNKSFLQISKLAFYHFSNVDPLSSKITLWLIKCDPCKSGLFQFTQFKQQTLHFFQFFKKSENPVILSYLIRIKLVQTSHYMWSKREQISLFRINKLAEKWTDCLIVNWNYLAKGYVILFRTSILSLMKLKTFVIIITNLNYFIILQYSIGSLTDKIANI